MSKKQRKRKSKRKEKPERKEIHACEIYERKSNMYIGKRKKGKKGILKPFR